MPKRIPSAEEITKILHTLNTNPWKYSEMALEEFIDQHYADYGQKIRAYALEVFNQWNP
jgi:hypothetical protein